MEQLRLDIPLGGEARGAGAIVTRDDGSTCDPRDENDWRDWVAAGATRRWCDHNELVDWLDLHGIAKGFVPDTMRAGYDERLDFSRWLGEQAHRFEDAVRAHLSTLVPVARIEGERNDARSLAAAQATWAAMARGESVIAQGVLRDPQARMYGKVDLLVRSDVLANLCESAFDDGDDPAAPAPALGGAPWHYRVVDVKYSTVNLLKSGDLSLSTELDVCAQLWAYNAALGRLQGLIPPFAYVASRAWRQGQERGDLCWERLARVPRDGFLRSADATLGELVAAGATWVRRLRAEGGGWEVLPRPRVPELWPNVKASTDGAWHRAKTELAQELGELTLLRSVGLAQRRRAHDRGVLRWDDGRVNADLFGIPNPKDAAILDRILEAQRAPVPLLPARIVADEGRWRERAPAERYVDFETVNDLGDDLATFPRKGGVSLIFQIGSGAYEDGRWTFRQCTAPDLTADGEGQMIDEWIAHLRETARQAGLGSATDVRLFHWSAAETIFMDAQYRSARERHPEKDWPELGWYDLLKNVMHAEPVVIKGCMAFGLKAVARAMHAHGLIATDWGEGLADGTGAMAGAWRSADDARRTGRTLPEIALMREIDRYNEIDCRVMAEVLDHLRREH